MIPLQKPCIFKCKKAWKSYLKNYVESVLNEEIVHDENFWIEDLYLQSKLKIHGTKGTWANLFLNATRMEKKTKSSLKDPLWSKCLHSSLAIFPLFEFKFRSHDLSQCTYTLRNNCQKTCLTNLQKILKCLATNNYRFPITTWSFGRWKLLYS